MPYIKKDDRALFQSGLDFLTDYIRSPGEANYVITKMLLEAFDPESYSDFNEIIGILECCKLEFYRRAVATYEDAKIKENGDVY